MKPLLVKLSSLALGILILGTGCSESSTLLAPAADAESPATLAPSFAAGPVSKLLKVKALKRTAALAEDVSVTAVIDPDERTVVEIPGIATVTFPEGTFEEAKTITMTAPKGKAVALDFTHVPEEEFQKPVTISLSLVGTEAEGNLLVQAGLQAGHFNSRADIEGDAGGNVTATVDRVLGVRVTNDAVVFEARGFSGYLCGSGRCDTSCETT